MSNIKHRMSKTREYAAWRNMRNRCYNPKHPRFKYYGGRGIKVCDEWKTFLNFYLDMGDIPDGLELDKIDNEKDYCKKNCRWSNRQTQMLNRMKFRNCQSKFRGVCKDGNRFRAYIYNPDWLNLGSYKDEYTAAEAVDCANFLYKKDRSFKNRTIMDNGASSLESA